MSARPRTSRWISWTVSTLLAVTGAVGLALPRPAQAQPVLATSEALDFDRPEAWALKYFSSVTLMTRLEGPSELEAGGVELGLEAGWIPSLSESERRVGFYGTKVEDLNRSPVFGRLRVGIGLGGRFRLSAAYAPPVDLDGVEPHLFALALDRPLLARPRWTLAGRLFAQHGRIRGDITCPRAEVEAGNDPVANPFQCERPSEDEVTLRTYGLEAMAGWKSAGEDWLPYATISAQYLDPEFQIDARYAGLRDLSHQSTDGITYAATLGVSYAAFPRVRVSGELFYSPLSIQRSRRSPVRGEDLLNARVSLGYRLR